MVDKCAIMSAVIKTEKYCVEADSGKDLNSKGV